MTEQQIVDAIIGNISSRVANSPTKKADWETTQQSVMNEVVDGIAYGVHLGLEEHKQKLNELVLIVTWLVYTHPAHVLTSIPPALIEFLKNPIKPPDLLT